MSSAATSQIESRAEKCGGRPCIAGTRIRVQDIYVWHALERRTPEEIVANFPQLSVGDVQAAIAYYEANRDDIEGDIAAEKAFASAAKARHPSKLEQKLKTPNGDADSLSS